MSNDDSFPKYGDILNAQKEDGDGDGGQQGDSEVVVVPREKTQRPKRFKVLLHNDDYTTMEFVILVLQRIFNKSRQEAEEIMLKVHLSGVGVCGVYTHEVAETKAMQVTRYAREHGHPLKCTIEPEG